METALALLEAHGYWLLLAAGFAEFIGVPVATVPVLIIAGAAAAQGSVSLPTAVLAAATGGLLADSVWYGLSRWKGERLVDTVCNLTSNPRACVLAVVARLESMGPALILPSKFVPGTGNLVAASAGMAGIRTAVFLAADAIALAAWAGAYTAAGFVLSGSVSSLVDWIAGFRGAAGVAASLILGAVVWRYLRARAHREPHRRMLATSRADTAG